MKILRTLRTDPIGSEESLFSTETRVVSTHATAQARFRWYLSFFLPGMILIRWLSLGPLRAEAERRTRSVQIERSSAAVP